MGVSSVGGGAEVSVGGGGSGVSVSGGGGTEVSVGGIGVTVLIGMGVKVGTVGTSVGVFVLAGISVGLGVMDFVGIRVRVAVFCATNCFVFVGKKKENNELTVGVGVAEDPATGIIAKLNVAVGTGSSLFVCVGRRTISVEASPETI